MHRRLVTSWVVVVAILAGFTYHDVGLAQAESNETDKVFVGYLFRRPREINWKLYTHLCHAFLVADENGRVLERRGVPSREWHSLTCTPDLRSAS
jgi:chitinase